ncbi:uncharacterized protein NPIL_676991 [Nephila pilipes]|uniref:Uncharacterized protein n=1 Tax=Nephila pilipes TaxID=299642 RepID=A0A8X6U0R2_NEPPI|nr:uncharacterized protein NPIL_676991 [Nephila pilipes]
MASEYSIEERKKISVWMEVFQSPSIVQERFRSWTLWNTPLHLTSGWKFHWMGSFHDCMSYSNRERFVRTEENIILLQEAVVVSPNKSTRTLSPEI